MTMDAPSLSVWRLHPRGCAVRPAERSLEGTAHRGGVRWCGPFTNANKYGWWLSSPVDLDVTWRGGDQFDYELHTDYDAADEHLLRFLLEGEEADRHAERWLPPGGRTKFTWGLLEPGVLQIWSGCIFRTPPGWALMVRSPVNAPRQPYSVMEAVIESDWLHYDVWLNLQFHEQDVPVRLRRDSWPPVAQLLPVRREGYDRPGLVSEQMLHRGSEEGEEIFKFFVQYNEEKFAGNGQQPIVRDDPTLTKDSTTYYRQRRQALSPPRESSSDT